MVNFGLLAAEIRLPVWGTPSKFQRISRVGFVSLHRRRSSFQRTSTKLCTMLGRPPSPGLVQVYTFPWALAPDGILPGAKFTLHPNPVLSYKPTGSVTARYSSSGRKPSFAAWYKEWN